MSEPIYMNNGNTVFPGKKFNVITGDFIFFFCPSAS